MVYYGNKNFNTDSDFTGELSAFFDSAKKFAATLGLKYVSTEILLYAIAAGKGRSSRLLAEHDLKPEDVLKSAIDYNSAKNGASRNNSYYTEAAADGRTARVKKLVKEARFIAQYTGCHYIASEHALLAMTGFNCVGNDILRTYCKYDALIAALKGIVSSMGERKKPETPFNSAAEGGFKIAERADMPIANENFTGGAIINRAGEAERTVKGYPTIEGTVLEKFGYDLTEKARKGKLDPVIAREEETQKIINALNRRNKNSPLLIGEPGTGKTAVVEGFAQRIVSGQVPASLKNKIVYSLDLTGIIAGAKFKGEFEARFKEMLQYVRENDVILFIDEIHNIVSGAKSDGMGPSEILKPALARGELQVIGATTIDEYRKYIEKDPALERRFSVINVNPPSVEDSIKIIRGLKDTFEAHHCVSITDDAIVAAVRLSDRFISDKFLPDKAIDLIDEASARARLTLESIDKDILIKEDQARAVDNEIDYARSCGRPYERLVQKLNDLNDELDKLYQRQNKIISRQTTFVDGDDIASVVAEWTGIPVNRLNETEKEKFLNLEKYLKKRVIGQDKAVKTVSLAIRRAMSGINDPNKPNGVFLFVGPTGVGKTELAKALTEALFADENKLIRIDMGEYMEEASVAKLIGAPPGYVGYEEEGQLTEKVRRNKFAVILFDEVEKAHPNVFNIMLQIFDDGRLTDSKGRLVDFKNTVIILTSNAGAQDVAARKTAMGFGGSAYEDDAAECYDRALKKQFKPEFLNRIDEIVYFDKLTQRDCSAICSLIMDGVKKRLADKNIYFSYDDAALDFIVQSAYNSEYGARPLKRKVCSLIEDEIAERILSGEIERGSRVFATGSSGEIKFIVE